MRFDDRAVGGFFEDLPVLAFVLAGVLSVSGTAAWTSSELVEAGQLDALERKASSLVSAIVSDLQDSEVMLTLEMIAAANLSSASDVLAEGISCYVTIWCVHPFRELLLSYGDVGDDPALVGSDSSFMNMLCDGGVVGVSEVRAIVWYE